MAILIVLAMIVAAAWFAAAAMRRMDDLAALEVERERAAGRCITCGYPRSTASREGEVCTECGNDPLSVVTRGWSPWCLLPVLAAAIMGGGLMPLLMRAFSLEPILIWLGLVSVPLAALLLMAAGTELARWPRRLRTVVTPALVVLVLMNVGCMASVPTGRSGGYPAGFGQSLASVGLLLVGLVAGPLMVLVAAAVQLGEAAMHTEGAAPAPDPEEPLATLGSRPGAGL